MSATATPNTTAKRKRFRNIATALQLKFMRPNPLNNRGRVALPLPAPPSPNNVAEDAVVTDFKDWIVDSSAQKVK